MGTQKGRSAAAEPRTANSLHVGILAVALFACSSDTGTDPNGGGGTQGPGTEVPAAGDAGTGAEGDGDNDRDASWPLPNEPVDPPTEPVVQPSYQEVFDQGLTRYVGTKQVQETRVEMSGSGSKALKIHHFSPDDRGPACMYGGEYFVESREGKSDTLMIFMQGGGVCLTEICAATPDPILSLQLFNIASAIGIGGVLDPDNEDNPTKDFDVVNAPYCDGSLFAGDIDRELPDGNLENGEHDMAFQRGLQNLTATLETAKKYYPNPPRIVLFGSSGGAYGVIAGTVLARYYYPETPLLVVSDSGAPIVNGVDTDFITRALTQINALSLIPKSCKDCLANGHATRMLEWALGFDENLTLAYMTHARDHVIGEFFMGTTAQQFEDAVVGETERLITSFPGRAFRFVIPSARHTLAMGMDGLGDGLQGWFLGIAGSAGVGFIGPDVDSEALSTWAMGGMAETGTDEMGKAWTGYEWLKQLIRNPRRTPNVLQLK